MTYNNPWTHNKADVTDDTAKDYVGFVYLITCKKTKKKYIGKKLFWFSKTRKLKGKKKRERVLSDWKTYYGSNKELQEDVLKLGEKSFKREVLYLCKTKGECSYWEAYEQFHRHVLASEDYYNQWISCKITRSHMPKKP